MADGERPAVGKMRRPPRAAQVGGDELEAAGGGERAAHQAGGGELATGGLQAASGGVLAAAGVGSVLYFCDGLLGEERDLQKIEDYKTWII